MEAFEILAEAGGGRLGERDDPEDVVLQHRVGDQREDVVVLLVAPAVVAPALSLEVPAVVAPPQGLEAPAVVAPAQGLAVPAVEAPVQGLVAPALSLVVPAHVRDGEDQGEAMQEGAGTVVDTTIIGTATDTTLGGTTGDGGGGQPSLG